MGSGAPKKIEPTISHESLVRLYAAEALVQDAMDNVSKAIQALLLNDSVIEWKALDYWRRMLVERNRLYTLAILKLQKTQERV